MLAFTNTALTRTQHTLNQNILSTSFRPQAKSTLLDSVSHPTHSSLSPLIPSAFSRSLRNQAPTRMALSSHAGSNAENTPSSSKPEALNKPSLSEIQSAAHRLKGDIVKTPLVQLSGDFGSNEIYLKLENLQPIGSFKLRGAGNVMKSLPADVKDKGVWTASAGNMAQGVAWYAQRQGLPCTIVVPDDAPEKKLSKIRSMDADIIKVPRPEWFQVLKARAFDGLEGEFIHPFADSRVMAGNGVIALEILEELPDVDVVIAPYGGGGLSCGIAAGMRAGGSNATVYACEPETAASLSASLAAGKPTNFEASPSFVDGMGSPFVFEEMWPLAQEQIKDSIVVSLEEIAGAIKTLHEKSSVIAEGAGAASLAAALKHNFSDKKIACIISGGNIDTEKVIQILNNEVPQPNNQPVEKSTEKPPAQLAAKPTGIEYLQLPGSEKLNLPFPSATRVDNTLYVSGNLGNLPGTLTLVPGGIEAETRQTMENIKAVLEEFDSSMDDVIKCTIFLADMDDWPEMNKVYMEYFDKLPARSAVGGSGIALGAKVEIECIALSNKSSTPE